MKLTLKIKLLPSNEQRISLIQTMKSANKACNEISSIAWRNRVFNQFKIHTLCYHSIKHFYPLGSQMIIRCISKVADAYKLDRKIKREFRPLGSITYDSRILNYKPNDIISIWTVDGRLKIPFICHNRNYLPYIKGEADLVLKKDKFYIFQTVEVPEEGIKNIEEFIGVDFGLIEIATLSNGKAFNSKILQDHREKRQKIRSSIQRKGTKSSKRLLKRLSGRERTFGTITNHTISKQIVQLAIQREKGIAIENLTGIRFRSKNRNKKFRTRIGRWSFSQLRNFISYKALLSGIPLIVVPPNYTSKTCSNCLHIGDRKGKKFTCNNCNSVFDADHNGAKNIALLGAFIDKPEKPSILYCQVHNS